jgi:protein O-mannosyl-transferase
MGPKKNKNRLKKAALPIDASGRKTAAVGQTSGARFSLKSILMLSAVLALTMAVYSNSISNGFVNWDDDKNVYENTYIRELSADNIKVYFTRPLIAMYTPIVYISYAADYSIGGPGPRVYHITNLLLHLMNITLVFFIIMLLTQRLEIAVIASLFFAVHPLNTGAVAPVSTRSGLLYSFFSLVSFLCYIRYLKDNFGLRHLAFAFIFFLLAVMSKSAAVILPLVFLLADYYCKRKFDARAITEKIPFFVLSIIFGVLTFVFREDAGHIGSQYLFTPFERIFLVGHSIVFYVLQLLIPVNLSAYHPYPEKTGEFLPILYYLSPLVIAASVLIIYKMKQYRRELIFGALFFFINILLILKIIPMGGEIVCDRYAYLPSIGLFFIIGWAYCRAADMPGMSAGIIKKLFIAALVFWCVLLSIISYERNKVWENSITLYDDIIEKYPNVILAYSNRGSAKITQGDYAGAIADFNMAIERDPYYVPAYNNRGLAYRKMGEYEKALNDYNIAIRISPKTDILYNNRGFNLVLMGSLGSAEQDIRTALGINSDSIDALNSMAELFAARKDPEMACKYLGEAIQKGYSNWDYIKTSGTYDNIRTSDCFRSIIAGK